MEPVPNTNQTGTTETHSNNIGYHNKPEMENHIRATPYQTGSTREPSEMEYQEDMTCPTNLCQTESTAATTKMEYQEDMTCPTKDQTDDSTEMEWEESQ
ncbi:hypothetical protein J6590_070652 [Homalodisca vitripennis]|nr:hypothetical protein J6590_070652 [Homalodisca vitripennis]